MKNTLILKSKMGTSNELSFCKILNGLDSIGLKLTWSILDFEAMGDLGNGKSILDFESEINTAEKGKILSWNELKDISLRIRQVIFMTLIGTKDSALINRNSIENKNYDDVEIVVNVIDGYFWEIYIKDPLFFKKFKEIFAHLNPK